MTIYLRRGSNGIEVHHARSEPWRITLVETGATTMTGGRLAAIRPYLDPDEPFCFTYGDGGQINGGFFVADPSVLNLIDGPDTVWESGPLEQLAAKGEPVGYRHNGFWHPMDTLRDKLHLDALWQKVDAPWKRWRACPMPSRW